MEYIEIDDLQRFQTEAQVKTMKYKNRDKTELQKQSMTKRVFVSEIMNKEFDMKLIATKYIPEYTKVLDAFMSLHGIKDLDSDDYDPKKKKQMDIKYVGKSLDDE